MLVFSIVYIAMQCARNVDMGRAHLGRRWKAICCVKMNSVFYFIDLILDIKQQNVKIRQNFSKRLKKNNNTQLTHKNMKHKENRSNDFAAGANSLHWIWLFCTGALCFTTCYLWNPSRISDISYFLEVVRTEHDSFPEEPEALAAVCMCACSSIKASWSRHQSHTPY